MRFHIFDDDLRQQARSECLTTGRLGHDPFEVPGMWKPEDQRVGIVSFCTTDPPLLEFINDSL
ncbi:MAG: hypothetical protein CTY25_07500 [Methylobacterium sp.]|nr:MAG: hypothetical protein CTY25_07500 [Methylobacterium sp.]